MICDICKGKKIIPKELTEKQIKEGKLTPVYRACPICFGKPEVKNDK